MSTKKSLTTFFFLSTLLFCLSSTTDSFAIVGYCAGCHTMHNSQDDLPMRYDGGTTPIGQLLRGDCYGCHAMNVGVSLFTIGTDKIPQVFHSGPSNIDLAGGNFRYITGGAGTGASDTKGHNISDLTGTDSVLSGPPGGIVQSGHNDGGNVNTTNLQCAGTNGCHGIRGFNDAGGNPILGYEGITGAHHDNLSGDLDPSGDFAPGHGYRFLTNVSGYEDTDWEATETITDHNEYFGNSVPSQLGCGGGGELNCHGGGGVRAPTGTISEFCGTCHGNFHTLATSASDGIGSVAASPFIRHPTDYSVGVIAGTEYASYTTYDLDSPIARTTVALSSGSGVDLSNDAVMCLSCHVAHGSDYDDMLRWDYSTMTVGGGATNPAGCFACHTGKD